MMTRQQRRTFARSGGSRQARHVSQSRVAVTIGAAMRGSAAVPEGAEIARIASWPAAGSFGQVDDGQLPVNRLLVGEIGGVGDAAPIASVTIAPSQEGRPASSSKARIMPEKLATDPTERSISPEMMTKVMPIAMTETIAVMRSGLATDVPPNFCTISIYGQLFGWQGGQHNEVLV